jgi:hypothetical protein
VAEPGIINPKGKLGHVVSYIAEKRHSPPVFDLQSARVRADKKVFGSQGVGVMIKKVL